MVPLFPPKPPRAHHPPCTGSGLPWRTPCWGDPWETTTTPAPPTIGTSPSGVDWIREWIPWTRPNSAPIAPQDSSTARGTLPRGVDCLPLAPPPTWRGPPQATPFAPLFAKVGAELEGCFGPCEEGGLLCPRGRVSWCSSFETPCASGVWAPPTTKKSNNSSNRSSTSKNGTTKQLCTTSIAHWHQHQTWPHPARVQKPCF